MSVPGSAPLLQVTPPPAPPAVLARRGPSLAASFARLGLFLLVSLVAGVLVAGTALPFVGGAGVATRTAIENFESLPSQLAIPQLPQRSVILAKDGSLIASIYQQNRLEIPLARMAPVMRQAIVAVEDGRFYEHRGVDPRGLVRALVGNASSGGGSTQGGSTLTQQYIKNVFVESATSPEDAAAARARTLSRKVKELRYALALERQLTKDQILANYLNIAYFGAGAYGVEAASLRYFSKHADKLTLVEAATLAGVVQQPVAYDPLRNPKSSQKRRAQVLTRMAELGYISQEAAAKAAVTPTAKFLKPSKPRNGCTTSYSPFFCDYVYRLILNDPAFGKTPAARENLLRIGGLRITTTLDPVAQRAAQQAVDKKIPRKDSSKKVAAITMVRPSTGEIVAMAENRSWGVKGLGVTTYNFNVGTKYGGSHGAQAGSTFKAFTLAAALEKGESPWDYRPAPQVGTFNDFKNCQTGAPWGPVTIHNSTGAGSFNMLSGTAYSINTYFMGLEEKITQCAPRNVAARIGLTRGDGSPLQANPTFTLGTDEVTPLGMASAYAVFANHGVRCQPIAIARVTDRRGKDLRVPLAGCKQIIERQVADSVTSILSQVIDGPLHGRTGAAMSLGRDAAGKTGTINDSAAVWFVGFTPDLAAAVATFDPRGGYGHPMKNITIGGRYFSQVFGSSLPGPIWKDAMKTVLATVPPTKFDLFTMDGLGVFQPPPTPPASPSPTANPSGGPSGSPAPGGSPGPKPAPTPSTKPTPSPTTP
jgi:membrane peptidoglycan carboxypeptidase